GGRIRHIFVVWQSDDAGPSVNLNFNTPDVAVGGLLESGATDVTVSAAKGAWFQMGIWGGADTMNKANVHVGHGPIFVDARGGRNDITMSGTNANATVYTSYGSSSVTADGTNMDVTVNSGGSTTTSLGSSPGMHATVYGGPGDDTVEVG